MFEQETYRYRHGGNVHVEPGGATFLDFSANINPLGPPKEVEQAIRAAIPAIDRYPDSRSTELRAHLAEFEGVSPEWIFCGAGSSDILFRLPRAVNARNGLILRPTFSDYERSLQVSGAGVFIHPLNEETGFVCDEGILSAVKTTSADLLFLCNPNNPTGVLTDISVIERLLKSCRKSGITVLVDECFLDLASEAATATAKSLLREYENLVILKAFTKSFALPGLRLGYAMCADPRMIDRLYACGPDWPVSNLAQAAGIAALNHAGSYLKESVDFIVREREFLKDELEKSGYRIFDGRVNFLLAKNPHEFDIKTELDKSRIRVRTFDAEEGLDSRFFRIAVSTHENNVRLIESVRKVTKTGGFET